MEDQLDPTNARKLRPRRSVLSDISNRITDLTKKVTKKRKLSGANDAVATSSEVLAEREHVQAASSSSMASSSSAAAPEEVQEVRSSSSSASVESVDSSSADLDVSAEDDITVVWENPNKIKRSLPLRLKAHDPAQCTDILDSMYELYYENEVKYSAAPYMHTQEDLNNKMRSILVDWLVEVHHKFKLYPATLWLCVNILDRFLTKVPVKRGRLQLVGIAAFFIACKFEEVYPPEAKDFVHITDNAYSRQEMLAMESDILGALNYEILVPTGFNFLTRYLNCIRASENTRLVASYYAERNLQEPHMLEVKPHLFAAAALYAALCQQSQRYPDKLLNAQNWCRALQEESHLTEEDIIGCARTIVKHVREEPVTTSKRKLIAAKKKYLLEKYNSVALLNLPVI